MCDSFKNANNLLATTTFALSPVFEQSMILEFEIPDPLGSFVPMIENGSCSEDRSCVGCPEECSCAGDEDDAVYAIPEVDKIIFENMCTIVYWCDGTKTVVHCGEGDKYSRYAGFAAAVCKKLFGSTTNAMKLMDLCDVELQKQRERIAAKEAAKQEAERKAAKREEEKKLAEKKFHEDVSAALYQHRVETEAKRIMKEMNENK